MLKGKLQSIKNWIHSWYDLDSIFKSVWLTKFVLIIWRWDDGIKDFGVSFFPEGWE